MSSDRARKSRIVRSLARELGIPQPDQERTDHLAEKWRLAEEMAQKMGIRQEDVQRQLVGEATGEDTWHTHEAMMEEKE